MRALLAAVLVLSLTPALAPGLAGATPIDGSYRNEKGAVLFVENAAAEGFDFTLSSTPTCPEGETQCLSVTGHAAATAKGYAFIDPEDDHNRVFFVEQDEGIKVLSTTGDLGTGTANRAALLVLVGAYAPDPTTENLHADMVDTPELHFFQSPTGNIACLFILGAETEVRCDLKALNRSFTTPPEDCDLDWGDSFSVASSDRKGQLVCHGDTVIDPGAEVLDYGSTLSHGDILCQSEKTGMTCQTRAGHGFTLSRKRQELF